VRKLIRSERAARAGLREVRRCRRSSRSEVNGKQMHRLGLAEVQTSQYDVPGMALLAPSLLAWLLYYSDDGCHITIRRGWGWCAELERGTRRPEHVERRCEIDSSSAVGCMLAIAREPDRPRRWLLAAPYRGGQRKSMERSINLKP